jgi:putative molybdopterin biosynthesis protein
MDPGDILSAEQVAELFGVHRTTVYDLIERGEIPAVKVARRWRIRRQDIEALLAGELT